MNRVLVDTTILVDIWRNGASQWPELEPASNHISTVSYIEFLQGSNRRDKEKTIKFLDHYGHIRLDHSTCDTAIELIRKHSETHGLRLADSLIAATCLVHDLDLLTLNRRHFQKIANLKLI